MVPKLNDVKKLLIPDKDSFPTFSVGHNYGRGLYSDGKHSPHIIASQDVVVWKIVRDTLQLKENTKVLFNEVNYVIEWTFEYVLSIGAEVQTEVAFFHWKGMNALKGFSPLPPGRDLDSVIVDRIYQWSEPPAFFHIFPDKLIVLSGKEEDFNSDIPHLFILRGEIVNEMHLFEIPCQWKHFRSRAIFFLIVPEKQTGYIWFGSGNDVHFAKLIRNFTKLHSKIRNIDKSWENLQFVQVNEGDDEIVREIVGNTGEYLNIEKPLSFSPRLFYFDFQGDEINPVEVKNPLRAPNVISPFPFLQSHLYTARQPAIFLVDNQDEIWLWQGTPKSESDTEILNHHLKIVKEFASVYVIEKKNLYGINAKVQNVNAGQEPIAFTNIFPYWKE